MKASVLSMSTSLLVLRRTSFAFLAAFLGSCMTNTEPLATDHLQAQLDDPGVSIVLLRFQAPASPPVKGLFGGTRQPILWHFAAANEATGWNFRALRSAGEVYVKHDETSTGLFARSTSGWVSFLVPAGKSYLAVSCGSMQNAVVAPHPTHISVNYAADENYWLTIPMMDFTGLPRFAVEVTQPRSLIYAGTIVRTNKCEENVTMSRCDYSLRVIDESDLAAEFVEQHRKGFSIDALMQTRLLDIPQTRTITIRDHSTEHRHENQ